MSDREWYNHSSAAILTALASTPSVSVAEDNMIRQMAWLNSKHKELQAMDPEDAMKKFDKLDISVQEALRKTYGEENANYIRKAEENIFQKVTGFFGDVGSGVMNALGGYGQALSNPYRMWRVAMDQDRSFWDRETWDIAWDGEQLFDKEREAKVRNEYSAAEFKLAKAIAIGKNLGEIAAGIDPDNVEMMAAYERLVSGKDERINAAIRDLNDSKISWGRDLARLMGLNPEVGQIDQGIEGGAYKFVSGAADIIGDVAFDPLTYLFIPAKALQGARYGLVAMAKAEAGDFTTLQKLMRKSGLTRTEYGVEGTFQLKGVRDKFDEIGALVKRNADTSLSAGERNAAALRIREIAPQFDENVVAEFTKAKVFDADSAVEFFKNSELRERVLRGASGTKQLIIPHSTVFSKTRQRIFSAVGSALGRTQFDNAPIAEYDDMLEVLSKGGSIADKENAAAIRRFSNRHAKMIQRAMPNMRIPDVTRLGERAMIDRAVYVGGLDELGRDMGVRSARSIYTIARTFLPKYDSNIVASAYANAADSATRRNIIRGLYNSMADSMGIDRLGQDKRAFDKLMQNWEAGVYSEQVIVTQELIDSGIAKGMKVGDVLNPATVKDDLQYAISPSQLSSVAQLPDLMGFAQLARKKPLVRGVSNTVNNRHVTAITDFWSALNLLPRLGLRSVIDENTFHLLTIPIVLLPKVIEGYRSSIMGRIIRRDTKFTKFGGKPVELGGVKINHYPTLGEKDIGVFARIMRPFFVKADEATLRKARSSMQAEAELVEESLTKGFWSKLIRNEQDAKYMARHSRYGYARSTEGFSSGVSQSQAGAASAMRSEGYQFDRVLNINVEDAMRELDVEFDNIAGLLSSGTPEFKINMLIQLNNRVDNEIGRLAVAYMKDPKAAVREITAFLKGTGKYKGGNGPELLSKFERAQLESVEQIAQKSYLHVRNLFLDPRGNINDSLLNLVKKTDDAGKTTISATDITYADIDAIGDTLPATLMGYQLKAPVFETFTDFLSSVIDRGFQIADRQIATLSREPVMNAYVMHYSRQLASSEAKYIDDLLKNNPKMSREAAEKIAERRYAFLANELAMNRVIGFIDNPNVRSNLAFSARNLARYYRATEDWWRRATRVIKNDPQALVRLRMSMEGLDHAGFIYEDEQGEKYFMFPVDNIMYTAYSNVIYGLTGERPATPMPMNLTGQIKMLAPSFDPESSIPTLSSPFMAVGWGVISKLMPPEYADQATRALFGKYAEGRDLGEAVTPSVLRRFAAVAGASLGHESEQVASATMKALAMLEATNPLPPDANEFQKAERLEEARAAARTIVALRNTLGIVSPVSPGLMENADVTPEQLALGVVSFKTEWNNLLNAEFKKGSPDPFNTALNKWNRLFPGRLPYIVSETETDKVASISKAKEAVDWARKNKSTLKDFPEGGYFFMPQMAGFDFSSYAYLKREGIIKRRDLDEYFLEVSTVQARLEYDNVTKKYDQMIASANTPDGIANMKRMKDQELSAIRAANPRFAERLGNSTSTEQLKLNALNDVRRIIDEGRVPKDSTETAKALKALLDVYDRASMMLNYTSGNSNMAVSARARIRGDYAQEFASIVNVNPNAREFYDSVIKGLLGL